MLAPSDPTMKNARVGAGVAMAFVSTDQFGPLSFEATLFASGCMGHVVAPSAVFVACGHSPFASFSSQAFVSHSDMLSHAFIVAHSCVSAVLTIAASPLQQGIASSVVVETGTTAAAGVAFEWQPPNGQPVDMRL